MAMLAIAILGVAGAAVVFAGYNIYKAQLPDAAAVAALEPPQDSYVYDGGGTIIKVYHQDANGDLVARHTHVALADISRWARLATIDIEDRHFYSEGSWDLPRLVEAGLNDITHSGSIQGASTITEQLAKLSFAGEATPRSLDYKIKEIVLGNEIASEFTKDQILEMYMNRIYYGNFATGIQTAAQLYFMTDASKLDLAQSAMLAGLPQSPSYYDPLVNPDQTGVNPLAKQRQSAVLQAMVTNGDITQKQANAAYAEKLTFHSWQESEPDSDGSFVQYLTSYLQFHFGDSFIDPGGWRIYTTLYPPAQSEAQAIVHQQVLENAAEYNMHDASLVSLDPRNGYVLAMVGGDNSNQFFGQDNLATTRLNPGSSIKLFTYTAAIASGKYTMTTPILDAPTSFPIPGQAAYKPLNYDRKWHGTCELKECLGNSFNVPAVKVEAGTGIPYIDSLEYAAGVHSISPNTTCTDSATGQTVNNVPGPYDYAATLGFLNCGISLLDLANGAATIANLGVEHDATPIVKIYNASGAMVYSDNPDATAHQVVPANVAFIMNEITSNNNNRIQEFGTHSGLVIPGRRVSAKTGTGEGGTGNGFMDNLTVGWTPDFLTAVWVGNPDPWCSAHDLAVGEPCGTLTNVASGITGAAPIWNQYMSTMLPITPDVWYTIPKDVIQDGTGDNANFFLPGTQSQTTPGGGCYYWGPSPDPNNPCTYTGLEPPPWYTGGGGGGNSPNPTPGPLPTGVPVPGGHRRHH